MSKPHPTSVSRETRESITNQFPAWLLKRTLQSIGDAPLRVVLPNQKEIVSGPPSARTTIRILNNRALWAIIRDPVFQFAERYSDGDVEIHGDLAKCLTDVFRRMSEMQSESWMSKIVSRTRVPRFNGIRKSRQNIHHHYDIGNDFYRLWLDENMVYTCAYFEQPDFSLERAQNAKMDLVCRKVRLKPGMKVIEAGCGWGALAIHMAQNYGVRVQAYNISKEQVDYARARAKKLGLSDQVEFVFDDWRISKVNAMPLSLLECSNMWVLEITRRWEKSSGVS